MSRGARGAAHAPGGRAPAEDAVLRGSPDDRLVLAMRRTRPHRYPPSTSVVPRLCRQCRSWVWPGRACCDAPTFTPT